MSKEKVETNYNNPPGKDIFNAIWGECFDYKDEESEIEGVKIKDRIYSTWQRIEKIINQSKS